MSAVDGQDHVVDDVAGQRFVVERPAGTAELIYRVSGHRLILVHTEVPEAFRGQGVADQLVRAAIERAVADGLTVVPACPYARTWLEHHREVAATVTIDWGT